MSIEEKVIQLIERNRISSTEVADALGKTGLVPGLSAVTPRKHRVGLVSYIYAYDESNWPVHEQIAELEEGKMVFIDTVNCGERAVLGDLVSKYLLLYKRAKAVVVNGRLRDVHTLIKEDYPMWSSGSSPIGCFNRKPEKALDPSILAERKAIFEKGIMVCDDSGVVIISPDRINDELYRKLEFIELQEDIWYFCLDTKKMSTFEIVCEKKYLTEPDFLDGELAKRMQEFSDELD